MIVKFFVFNPLSENTLVAYGEKPGACVVIDPSWYRPAEREAFFSFLEKEGLTPEAILLTHCHFDHILGVSELQNHFDIPVYASEQDSCVLSDRSLFDLMGIARPAIDFKVTGVLDGQRICCAGLDFKVITTPGHTPGGVCWYAEKQELLFSGDTLFAGAIGRTDFKFGDYDKLIVSIMDKLMGLPSETMVYPGHGGPTTIGTERMTNPFLEPFNNPEDCRIEDQSSSLR